VLRGGAGTADYGEGVTAKPVPDQAEKPISRRVVLGILGLGALGIVFGQRAQNGISDVFRSVHAGGLASLVPGNGGFTIYTVTDGYPAAPPDYHLTVDGMVEHPLRLSVTDLEALPATRLTHDFQCVTGWRVADVHWSGVRLTELARRAGALPSATDFHFTSFDGAYTESLTMDQAEESGAIVAYSMLGAPVTREHGGPVRLFVPGMFGYKSIKWLSGVRLVDRLQPGYWEQNGYPENAWITGRPPSTGA
jgi:DMSO/TMAO reductase YedYZ molybdopterin-dependent catalytic subunit